jgi:hypothetical protein
MVSISQERRVETERRLRDVVRLAEVVHLEARWRFVRLDGDAPPDALATVRDPDGWCALVPTAEDAGERFGLTRITFGDSIENSGFVGWLASTIKRELGSGVFVICGDNPRRGGIFDYLGYPLEVADAVRALIDDLRQQVPTDDPFDLDLRLFRVVETSPASAISPETLFEFRECNGTVEAVFSGGVIVSGSLVGRRISDRVEIAYSQLDGEGGVRTGTSLAHLEARQDGRLRLIEDYTWSDGTAGWNVLESTAPVDAS